MYNDKANKLNPYGEVFGYVRVSTKEQKEDRQLIALETYGVDPSHIFVDKQSGKDFNRPSYKKLIHVARKGDIIVIKSIDRLGRNYQDIIDQWRMITQDIGCGIHVMDMPALNTSGNPDDLISKFITDMMLQVLSFVAENERETTLKRQKEGLAAAKKRGKLKIGRPKIRIPFEFWEIFIMWKTGATRTSDLLAMCKETYGMSQRTFYRRIRELDMRFGDIPPNRLRDVIIEDDEIENGFELTTERLEAGIGYRNPYSPNPEYVAKRKALMKAKPRVDKQLQEEQEIKRIILEKRQEAFRERFHIPDNFDESIVKRGRNKTKKNIRSQSYIDPICENIKTVIVD